MFAPIWICLVLLHLTGHNKATTNWKHGKTGDKEAPSFGESKPLIKNIEDEVKAISGISDRSVRQIGPLLAPLLGGVGQRLGNLQGVISPIYQQTVAQTGGLVNIGTGIASRFHNLVTTGLGSTLGQNHAVQHVQPHMFGQAETSHNVHIGPPKVSIISTSQVQVTCTGNVEDCRHQHDFGQQSFQGQNVETPILASHPHVYYPPHKPVQGNGKYHNPQVDIDQTPTDDDRNTQPPDTDIDVRIKAPFMS